MPIEYKTYGCKYKCGFKHNKDIYIIEKHEEICWYNPKNKTCITCKYASKSYLHDLLNNWFWECTLDPINSGRS